MKTELKWLPALAVGLVTGSWHDAQAADPKPTTVTVPSLHCAGCAKKVAAKLKTVPFVDKAEPDFKTKTVKVTPKADKTLSPKALWEAVEGCDETPSKLEGPSGTFTSKPKS